jgi:hypothetical protein
MFRINIASPIFYFLGIIPFMLLGCGGGNGKLDYINSHSIAEKKLSLYDTNGSSDEAKWTEIIGPEHKLSSPLNIVLQNGFIRVAFDDVRLFTEQRGAHSWYLSNGHSYIRATDPYYGDYTYFVSTVLGPPTDVTIVESSKDRVIVDFKYEDHFVKSNFLIGGELVTAGPRPFTKRIEMRPDSYGAFVKLMSTPSNPFGEREFSLAQGARIFFGAAGDFIRDLFADENLTQPLPSSDYYLGFTNFPKDHPQSPEAYMTKSEDNFYYLAVPPKNFQMLMYKFSPKSFGGPIVQYFEEMATNRGMFVAIVPYENPFFMEAEYLNSIGSKILYYENNVRNGISLQLNALGELRLLPPKGLSVGSYRVVIRASTVNSTVQLLLNGVELMTQQIMDNSESYFNTSLNVELVINSRTDDLVLKSLGGSIKIDAVYYIPLTSPDGLFPRDIANKASRDLLVIQ